MPHRSVLRLQAILAAAIAAAFPLRLFGQTPADRFVQTPKTVDLAPVVITGLAPRSPLTFVTDPTLPRQPLPASDATDYLKTIPGFSAIRNGGSNGDPVLRGMFGSRLNILTNGGTLLGGCGGRMDAPSSYISPANFDTLIVVKGPQTVLWGPVASAGTIRFDRTVPRYSQETVRFDGSMVAGSRGRQDQAIDLTTGNERLYARLTGNHSQSGDYKDGDGTAVPARWNKWNGDLAVGITPSADSFVEWSAGAGDGQARYATRGMDGAHFRRESYGLRAERRNLGSVLTAVQAQVYYNRADHVMDNFSLRKPSGSGSGMMGMPMASNVERATTGGRIAATLAPRADLELVAGADMQRSQHRGRSAMGRGSYRRTAWTRDAAFGQEGVFSELTWHADAGNRLIGGARVDQVWVKDYRKTSGAMRSTPNPSAGQGRRALLPGGFARFEHDLASLPATVYAGLGYTARYPDYWELFSPGPSRDGMQSAFSAIRPEKTAQFDIGAQYETEQWDAWISGYAGRIGDFILFDYNGPGSHARNVRARILGGELGTTWRIAPRWTAGSSLAYAWGSDRSTGRPMAQIPPLDARLTLTYDNGIWSFGGLWRIVAPQRRYATGFGNVVGKDQGPSAGFGVFSAYGGYAVSRRIKLTAGIDNLFDKTYAEHLNLNGDAGFAYPAYTRINEPGRSIWARVSAAF